MSGFDGLDIDQKLTRQDHIDPDEVARSMESYLPKAKQKIVEDARRREESQRTDDEAGDFDGEVEEPEAGNFGTSGSSSTNDQQSVSDSSSTGPPPAPQQDSPDDDEHARSSVEEAQPAGEETEQEQTGSEPEPEEVEDPEPETAEQDGEQAADDSEGEDGSDLAPVTGEQPVEYDHSVSFKHSGWKSSSIKQVPAEFITLMRRRLAVSTGTEFAQSLSNPAVVVAFLAASLGEGLDTDVNTQRAIEGFDKADARIASLVETVEALDEGQAKLGEVTQQVLQRLKEIEKVTDFIEVAQSYTFAERMAIHPMEVVRNDPYRTLAVNETAAISTRDAVRAHSEEIKTRERDRERRNEKG